MYPQEVRFRNTQPLDEKEGFKKTGLLVANVLFKHIQSQNIISEFFCIYMYNSKLIGDKNIYQNSGLEMPEPIDIAVF